MKSFTEARIRHDFYSIFRRVASFFKPILDIRRHHELICSCSIDVRNPQFYDSLQTVKIFEIKNENVWDGSDFIASWSSCRVKVCGFE